MADTEKKGMRIFWLENMKEASRLPDPMIDDSDISKWILEKQV
jgi:hypothetical protein